MEEASLIEGGIYRDSNFGMVAIDWERRNIEVSLDNLSGETVKSRSILFDELKMSWASHH